MGEFFVWLFGAGVWLLALSILFFLLQVIAQWKLFTKAGEGGWKSLIPVYNYYTLFKITWSRTAFFVIAALMIASTLLLQHTDSGLCMVLGRISSALVSLITIIETYKVSRAYGHGFPYFLGLLFLEPLFVMILGLGSSRYVGKR